MSGGTNSIQSYAILAFSSVAVVTDLARGRIYNWLTLPMLISGLLFTVVLFGWAATWNALLAVVAGLLLFGWMFYLGVMGGGDVKFLMALGAWGGLRYVTEVAILSIAVGGVMSLGILIFSGRIVSFARRMYRFLLTVFVKELEFEAPQIDRQSKMPFGIPIAIAAVWAAFADPFQQLGVRLWN